MLLRKKVGQRLFFSISLVIFLCLVGLVTWSEYRRVNSVVRMARTQLEILLTQILITQKYTVSGAGAIRTEFANRTISKINTSILKELALYFEQLPMLVAKEISKSIAIVVLITVLSMVLLFFLVKKKITKPLNHLCQGALSVRNGNFSYQINMDTGDEFQEIANGFNNLTLQLQNFYEKLEPELEKNARLSSLGRMAAGIAHEMNNPLTSILGYTQLILSEIKEANPYYTDLKRIEGETKRLTKITRNFLNYSRPREPKLEPVIINNVIDKSLELVDHKLKYSQVEVIKDYEKELPPIKADEGELEQVFVNLLTNALYAFPDKEKKYAITLRTRYNQEIKTVEIEVSDTGIGIPTEILTRIFEPFFTTREKDKGSGLGLFVVSKIIQKYKGKIEVKSNLSEGTTFHISFPENLTSETSTTPLT